MSSTMKSLLVDEMTEGRSKKLKEHMQVDASTTLRRERSTYEEEISSISFHYFQITSFITGRNEVGPR